MNEEERFQSCLEYAARKHDGQFRIGGKPYITHPVAVCDLLRAAGYGPEYQMAALFHDLLEDTDATEKEIAALGGKDVLEAVRLLTKYPGFNMKDYVAGIRENPIACAVKNADRLHNLRSAVCADESFRRRYVKESIHWYYDFSPEIRQAVRELALTLPEGENALLSAE